MEKGGRVTYVKLHQVGGGKPKSCGKVDFSSVDCAREAQNTPVQWEFGGTPLDLEGSLWRHRVCKVSQSTGELDPKTFTHSRVWERKETRSMVVEGRPSVNRSRTAAGSRKNPQNGVSRVGALKPCAGNTGVGG